MKKTAGRLHTCRQLFLLILIVFRVITFSGAAVQFADDFPVKLDVGHIHIRGNPDSADTAGEEHQQHHADEAEGQVKVTSLVSAHQIGTGLHGFDGAHLGIIDQKDIRQ